MKIALLGNGKTGSKVLNYHKDTTVFNSKNPITTNELIKHDIIISFLPGPAFLENLDLILASKKPLVLASTGFELPTSIKDKLVENNTIWIHAHNFSLGINIVKNMIEKLSKITNLIDDGTFTLKETHHTQKLDAPSGTAISMDKWLNKKMEIISIREGDIVGIHALEFKSPEESITLTHEAHDRSVFAKGALWAAKMIIEKKITKPGLYSFNDLVQEYI